MTLSVVAHGANVSSNNNNHSISQPGSPQSGDRLVIATCIRDNNDVFPTLSISNDGGWQGHTDAGFNPQGAIWSKMWDAGIPSSLNINRAFFGTSNVKFWFAAMWVVRSSINESITPKSSGADGGQSNSSETSTVSMVELVSGFPPYTIQPNELIIAQQLEDDRDVVWSSFDHDTFELTLDSTFNEGSGGAANWTGAAFASGVTDATHGQVSAANGESGNHWVMNAVTFEEPEPMELPAIGSGWGIPIWSPS